MAHSILTKPTGTVLSSALGEMAVTVDGTNALITFSAPDGSALLSERYWAASGRVAVAGLASLAEQYMRSKGISVADFTITVSDPDATAPDDTHTLRLLYCDRVSVCSSPGVFLRENFLTTLPMRRVAPDSDPAFYLYAAKGENLAYSVAATFLSAGSDVVQHHSYTADETKTATSPGVARISVSPEQVAARCAAAASVEASAITPLCFTVTCGARSLTCFVDRRLRASDGFLFRNCFNIPEWALLPALTKAKTEIDRPMATIGGAVRFYDTSATRTYETETGALTSDEAAWIDQLITSADVARPEPNPTDDTEPFVMTPVLITDCTCEVSDNPDEPTTVKFTWRLDSSRPPVRLDAPAGIFTSPYNQVFG